MLARDHWAEQNAALDAAHDAHRISLNLSTLEFPWDTIQALSFALFRTYAVPSIGRLLDETREFGDRVQKRYDDTGILLEEILEHSLDSTRGRSAVRRINQMHGRYDISNDDMRYVLSTFVVCPKRWLDDYGYRPLTDHELEAATVYYLELGRHMAIKDLPQDFAGFERLMDDYEREHFAFDPGARRVADSTLELVTTFPPNNLLPKVVAKRFALALMDEPLLAAYRFPRPSRVERIVARGALRLRAALIRRLPARSRPKFARDFGYFRTYPAGYEIDRLGTFPGTFPSAGCPVRADAGGSPAPS